MSYAKDTSVSVEKSRAEIEYLATKAGATHFGAMISPEMSVVTFCLNRRVVKFALPLPSKNDKAFTHTPSKQQRRSGEEAFKAWEQGCRQRWRALTLCIKAKLEAVEAGITTFEEEFLAHIVVKGGKTMGEHMIPQIDSAAEPRLMIGM